MKDLCVYIILVNYKSWQDTAECLESLFKLLHTSFKVVVVDNDSQNDSITHLKKWADGINPVLFNNTFYAATSVEPHSINKPLPYQHFKVDDLDDTNSIDNKLIFIESKSNLGFAAGNNIGIKLALTHQADYIWLLNNDTVVTKDSLTKLVEHFKKATHENKLLGILGAKLLYYHDPSLIQAVLGRYKPLMASTEHIGLNKPAITSFSDLQIGTNDYIVGASMFVSAEFIKKVGLMAEDYFLYFEEIDWVRRASESKYKIDVCLDAIVYHKEGASIGGGMKSNNQKSELSDFYSIRNRLIVTTKYYKKYLLPVYFSLIFVAANRVKRKQYKRIFLIYKAVRSSLRHTT